MNELLIHDDEGIMSEMKTKKTIKKKYEKPIIRALSIVSCAQTLGIGCKTTGVNIGPHSAPPCLPSGGTACIEPGS